MITTVKNVMFGAAAAAVIIGTAVLATLAVRAFALDEMLRRHVTTLSGAVGLFALMFVVVGAGAAVMALVRAMRR